MHLLLISRCPPYPLHLGDRLIVHHLARELAARGHTLDLLAFDERPELGAASPEGRAHDAGNFRNVAFFPDIPRPELAYLRRLLHFFPQTPAESWSPAMAEAITRRIAEARPDVVHVLGGVQVYEYAAFLNSLPAIITPYESFSLFLERAARQSQGIGRAAAWARLALTRAYERRMFTPYRRVVVLAEPDAATLRALQSAYPLVVIPNGIDPAVFHPLDLPRERHTLVFTGNYEYAPNVTAALWLARECFPRIRARLPDARLWLVGNAPPPALLALADDAITVTGRVDDVRPWLAQAALFVSPLTVGAGIKNKVLEAMAMGCPIVGTPLSFDGISLGEGAVPAEAVSAPLERLTEAALHLLEHPDEAAQMADRARSLIAGRYTWGAVAAAYEALYRQVAPHDSASAGGT